MEGLSLHAACDLWLVVYIFLFCSFVRSFVCTSCFSFVGSAGWDLTLWIGLHFSGLGGLRTWVLLIMIMIMVMLLEEVCRIELNCFTKEHPKK